MIHLIGNIAVWVALAASAGFCGLYACVPWRRSVEGWHLMTFTGVLAGAFAWIAYRQTTARTLALPAAEERARTLILSALALLLVWRFLLLIRAQTRRRRKR